MKRKAPGRCGKVVVFFSRGMSLEGWSQAGILERELALYRELSADVERFAFVTYGGPAEMQWADQLPNIEILPNLRGIAPNLYSVIAPWLHRKSLRQASIFRTNQINGAWCGVIAKVLFRKTLVVRGGFLWADFVARLTPSWWRRTTARLLEGIAMRSADRIVVAAEADASAIVARYGVDERRISVIPNYVDTCRFRPMPDVSAERGRVTFVGRLEAQKNLETLLEALRGLPELKLTVVGDGPLRGALETKARADGVAVDFVGRVPHERLPLLLNRSEIFVLPSHYEGSPKALVEAMACGVPVIGTRVSGIQELLIDDETGRLCGTFPSEIRGAIVELHEDAQLRARLGEGGLSYVRQKCSLAAAAERERALLKLIGSASSAS